jgi:hypothetical protein
MHRFIYSFFAISLLSTHLVSSENQTTYLICKPDTWLVKPNNSENNTFIKFTKGIFKIDVELNEKKIMDELDGENIWKLMKWTFSANETETHYEEEWDYYFDDNISPSSKNFSLHRKTLELNHRSSRLSKYPETIKSNCEIVGASLWSKSVNQVIAVLNTKESRIRKLHEEELKI